MPSSLLDFLASRTTVGALRPAPHNAQITSLQAAESIQEVAGRLRLLVYVTIEARGQLGATCDEIEGILNMKHQTASARVHELMKSQHIVDSGQRRLTSSNRPAIVWVKNGARR